MLLRREKDRNMHDRRPGWVGDGLTIMDHYSVQIDRLDTGKMLHNCFGFMCCSMMGLFVECMHLYVYKYRHHHHIYSYIYRYHQPATQHGDSGFDFVLFLLFVSISVHCSPICDDIHGS